MPFYVSFLVAYRLADSSFSKILLCGEKPPLIAIPRDRTGVRLSLLAASCKRGRWPALDVPLVDVPLVDVRSVNTAFGVFFWLQVANFDVFLFLVLHSVFLCWVVC